MTEGDEREARVFVVETRFQQLARRPGGLSRDKAIENATAQIEEIKPTFGGWIDEELGALSGLIKDAQAGAPASDWLAMANSHSRQIRDAGTTMGAELLTFIAASLCEVLDAIEAGAECNLDSIACHTDALFLARQQRYRGMRPDEVPELTAGLRRVAEVVSTSPG